MRTDARRGALALAAVALLLVTVPASAAAETRTLDDGIRAELQAVLEAAAADTPLPGVAASLVLADASHWSGVAGVVDATAAVPTTVERSTPFVIGSITKTFVAAAVLQLQDEGALDIDDPLADWLPAYPDAEELTLRHLLQHTSGVANHFEHPSYEGAVFGDPGRHWTPQQILDELVGPPGFAPGDGWAYSNTNYVLLGMVLEAVTGDDLATVLRERFFVPLDLDETWFQGADPAPVEVARGHLQTIDGGWSTLDDGSRYRPHTSAATVAWAAGSMVSTARDLTRWGHALYGGDVLEPGSLAEMLTYVRGGGREYGLGVDRSLLGGREAIGHTGSLRGYGAVVRYLPALDAAIAVTWNRGRLDGFELVRDLAETAFRHLDPDTTAPLAGTPRISLREGTRVEPGRVPVRVVWPVTETQSGVAAYELRMRTDAGPWTTVALPDPERPRTDLLLATKRTHEFQVRATDREGNVGPWSSVEDVRARIVQQGAAAVALAGAWQVASPSGALGGSLARTTSADAAATLSAEAIAMGWVGMRSARHGEATVRVDGAPGSLVDLRAGSAVPRSLLAVANWSTPGSHTLRIEALGTAGRPRVDVDAFAVLASAP